MSFESLTSRTREFATERDWEQFHTPKNLAMALAGEAGELLAEFQWLTAEESANLSTEQRTAVSEELADVLIYLCRLADVAGIDLEQAALDKIEANSVRYSIEVAKGNAAKVERSE
ncbi:MAG: nucleotide pyrophosphohydrolase [Candidatus Nanopelagicales bacterium]